MLKIAKVCVSIINLINNTNITKKLIIYYEKFLIYYILLKNFFKFQI